MQFIGGRYDDIVSHSLTYQSYARTAQSYDCHHLIAKSALDQWYQELLDVQGPTSYNAFLSDPKQGWAPAIVMLHEDHVNTLSYCNEGNHFKKQNALDYIDEQADVIIDDGDIIGVLKRETESIKALFGSKYNKALDEAWVYINSLQCRHVGRVLHMRNPNDPSKMLYYSFASSGYY